MKKVFTFFVAYLFIIGTIAFATTVAVTQGGEVIEYKITITLTPEEYDAMATECDAATYTNGITGEKTTGIEAWIQNAVHNRARVSIDKIVEKSGQGSRYTPVSQKISIIKNLKKKNSPLLKGAKEKMLEMRAKESNK